MIDEIAVLGEIINSKYSRKKPISASTKKGERGLIFVQTEEIMRLVGPLLFG
jgi:hypothetical protein